MAKSLVLAGDPTIEAGGDKAKQLVQEAFKELKLVAGDSKIFPKGIDLLHISVAVSLFERVTVSAEVKLEGPKASAALANPDKR